MWKKFFIGLGVVSFCALLAVGYYVFPYAYTYFKYRHSAENFADLPGAKHYCPAYDGPFRSGCFIEYMKTYDNSTRGYTLGLTLLNYNFVKLILEEGMSVHGFSENLSHKMLWVDATTVFVNKLITYETRAPASKD